jgi:serine/threonine-protein kinase
MDAERWARVEAILSEAMEAPAGARAGLVRDACGDDATLHAEVISLLAQWETDPDYLARPLVEHPAPAPDRSGESIGPWVITRLLGRGGMGEVYHAVRQVDDAAQSAALKVIRSGRDTDEVVRRFRLERRILSQLNHPNIAQLLDAGVTPDNRPYFAMELVEGAPLTLWCDDHRRGIRDRLVLFLRVCEGVEHAHQRLVVHRDLKPRNILVTADGNPKLLDFGIGKVLDDTGSFGTSIETRTELKLLTPEYAAPEQVTGGPITTATDVYALGVILYELLSGAHPHRRAGMTRPELEVAVLNEVALPPSARVAGDADVAHVRGLEPSALARTLAGDLDTIVLMALRTEASRRYGSAAALAQDIRRYLDGQPVSARPDTFGYRVRKFVGRNRGAVVAASAIAISLLGVAVTSVVSSRRVAREAARVQAERDKALEVRGFLLEMFGATGADQSVGDTVSVRALLDRQRAQLDVAYAGRDAVKADMLDVLADGYDRLGLYADAEPLARKALDLRQRLLPADHPDIATSVNLLGWILHERGQRAEAEPLLKDAVLRRRADSARAPEALARSLNDLGVLYNATQQYPAASTVLREALAIRRATVGDQHRAVGITANNLAAAFYLQKELDSAIAIQGLALRSLQASVGRDHQRTTVALSNLATFRRAKGDVAGAEADYRELLDRQSRLQGRDHPVTARVILSLASVLAERGIGTRSDTLLAEGEALHREALAAFERRLGPGHPQVATAMDRLAGVVLARGRVEEAISWQRRALAIAQRSNPDTSQVVRGMAGRLASMWRQAGDTATAEALSRQFEARR